MFAGAVVEPADSGDGLRAFCYLALVRGEGTQHLIGLSLGHIQGCKAPAELGGDFVELGRGDVQLAVRLLQAQVRAPGLRRRKGEWQRKA